MHGPMWPFDGADTNVAICGCGCEGWIEWNGERWAAVPPETFTITDRWDQDEDEIVAVIVRADHDGETPYNDGGPDTDPVYRREMRELGKPMRD